MTVLTAMTVMTAMAAGGGMATGFALVFLFAFVVVAVGVIGLFLKIGSLVVQGVFGPARSPGGRSGYHVCAARGCGHENRTGARYCAQCGGRLSQQRSVRGRR